MNAKKKAAAYLSGSIAVASAFILCIFLFLIIGGFVLPRAITVTIRTESAKQSYSGESLSADGYEIVSGELREGDTIQVLCTGSQTDVGSSPNTATATVKDQNGNDVTKYYRFVFAEGTLTVDPRPVRLYSSSAEKIYDGTPLTSSDCGIKQGSLLNGHKIELSTVGAQISAGKSLNFMNATVYDEKGNDVTSRYAFTYDLGALTVTPKPLTILAESASKPYDGTPLTCSDWRISAGSLSEGEMIEVVVHGSQTAHGNSTNYISSVHIYTEKNGVRTDKTSNYQIACFNGVLSITP